VRSKPAKDHWIDLALHGGDMGREDCQAGWHRFYAGLARQLGVTGTLDVGSGLGLIRGRVPGVVTQDVGPGLAVDLAYPVADIPAGSYDAVTCFDVIEHVVEDVTFLRHLRRIARRYVFITTPNWHVSRAANGCHCREHTPAELSALCDAPGDVLTCYAGDGPGDRVREVPAGADHREPHTAVLITKTNALKWAPWYAGRTAPQPYGDSPTYAMGAGWLAGCETVEDWGCGLGHLRALVGPERYRGVDGTPSAFADVTADLASYRSVTPGLFMRGVIEHDHRWREILANAVASFTRRMALVIFTPPAGTTHTIHWVEELGVPDIAFADADLMPLLGGTLRRTQEVASGTGYGRERVYYLEK
jgi:hypothetical protein